VIRRSGAHLETWRPYTLFYVGLVALDGAVLAGGHPSGRRLLAAWAVPTLGWIGGLYGGDYFDRDLDAGAKPHRPIPSGRLGAEVALRCMVGCAIVGAAVAVLLNWRTIVLVVGALLLAIAYNGFFKARGISGNLARGSLTGFAFLFGAMLTAPLPSSRLWPVALLFCLHDAGTNLVGTLRDVEGDGDADYRTVPVRHGFTRALQAVVVLAASWMALAVVVATLVRELATAWYFMAIGVAGVMAVASLVVLLRADRPIPSPTALRAHELLVVERIVLAGAFLTAAAAKSWTVPSVALALVLTVLSQVRLRARHEYGPRAATPTAATNGATEEVCADQILDYVDEQLAALSSGPALSGLRGWNRTIEIGVTDLGLSIHLVAQHGTLRRSVAQAELNPADVHVTTVSGVFRDIFLLGRTSPRRALLAGHIQAKAQPRDLLHLNQLFNEFRRQRPTPDVPVARSGVTTGPARVASGRQGEETAEVGLPVSIVISDTTLRDGEQAPGVAFDAGAKVRLATRLADIGVPLIEAGFPAVSADEVEAIRSIVDAGLEAVIQVIARPVDRDIKMAVESGAQSIAVFVGTSDAHIERKLGTDRARLLRRIAEGVAGAKRSGRHVVFAAEDATRTDPEYLALVLDVAANAGADAIGLADTVGVATPWSMADLVATMAETCPLPIAVHCHNDLGLATANSLAALRAGASGVQCSVLGIGERAGNAALEEVAVALEVLYAHATGLNLAGLADLAEEVARLSGQTIMPGKAVVGRNAFVHESGLHTSGIVRDPSTYEPYPPELTGRSRSFAAGKHSGRTGIQHMLALKSVVLDDAQLETLMGRIKCRAYGGTPLGEGELIQMAQESAMWGAASRSRDRVGPPAGGAHRWRDRKRGGRPVCRPATEWVVAGHLAIGGYRDRVLHHRAAVGGSQRLKAADRRRRGMASSGAGWRRRLG
jgi:isopropylmalate/homocitrate/citramalate synthase/4-hydroxybenzoate polyprenyltransferase